MSWPSCPECKAAETRCVDSRWSAGYTRRRYACPANHRWTTVEIPVDAVRGYAMVKGKYEGHGFVLVPEDSLEAMEGEFKSILERLKKLGR